MRTEIKTETVSERVRSEREQRTAKAQDPALIERGNGLPFGVPESLASAKGKPFRVCGAERDVRSMLFGFLRRFID